MDDGQVSEG